MTPMMKRGRSCFSTQSGAGTALLPGAAAALALLLAACGGDGTTGTPDGGDPSKPFEGRSVNFVTTYAAFPTSFGFRLVQDTQSFTQADICAGLKRYNNLVPLPAAATHTALYIDIQSAMMGDDVTITAGMPGVDGDLRFASVAEYQSGDQRPRSGAFALAGSGLVRVTTYKAMERVAGSYTLQFSSGDKLSGTFDATACPP